MRKQLRLDVQNAASFPLIRAFGVKTEWEFKMIFRLIRAFRKKGRNDIILEFVGPQKVMSLDEERELADFHQPDKHRRLAIVGIGGGIDSSFRQCIHQTVDEAVISFLA